MPPHRSPKRIPLGVRNRLPPVNEEGDDENPVQKKKMELTKENLQSVATPPPPPLEVPTAEEIAAADAALARMEEELRVQKKTADPIAIQNATIIEADEGSSESDDDDDEDEDEEEESKKGLNWHVNARRSSSRRSSVQHLSARERKAIRRLTAIMRDGGEARRAQERRDSMIAINRAQNMEAERRRQSERKRRMRSIAKIIDLSLVWDWLERMGCDDDTQRVHSNDWMDEREAAAHEIDSAEARAISDRLDAEAVSIVESIATTSMVEAFATELGLVFHGKAATKARPKVLCGLRDLTAITDLSPRVRDYDTKSGFYLIDSFLAKDICLTARRSFRDLKRLSKGLVNRGIPEALIPRLPRPRYVSGARKVFKNAFSKSHKTGNRQWEASKLPLIQTWLEKVINLIHNYISPGQSSQPEYNNKTSIVLRGPTSSANNFYAGFCCLSPAAGHFEDFLLKFAIVFHR